MKPNLVQCQVRAIFIGLLWWIPYLLILRYLPGPAALVFLAGFPVLIAFFVAVLTGPFDLLAIVSLLIPAAFDFLISTHIDWVWHSRHVGTLLGPSPILDVLTVVATVILAVIGIALKRWLVTKRGLELNSHQVCSLYKYLYWDVGLLVGIVAVLAIFDAAKIAHENDPQVLAETRKEILTSPTATEADKLQVVMKLQYNHSPETMDVLRQALNDPLPIVKFAAAASLLEKGDIRGLPVLEERLMHSSTITITNENQVIHSDWLGYGEGGPVSLTFNLSRALGNITEPNAVPILTRLMSSADPDTRSGAVQALDNIRLQNAHPQLHWMH
jgi:hypothetical protein